MLFQRLIPIVITTLLSLFFTSANAEVLLHADSFTNENILDRYDVRGRCNRCVKVRDGQLYVTNRGGREARVEMLMRDESKWAQYNERIEFSFRVKFTKMDYRSTTIFWQVNTPPFNGPDIMLQVERKHRFKVYVRKSGGTARVYEREFIGTAEEDRWYNFRVEFRRHLRRQGFVDIYINNQQRFSYDGPTTQSDSDDGRTKFGLYRSRRPRGGFEAIFDKIEVVSR